MATRLHPQPIRLSLSVLGYLDEGEWCALALEMDLRGYGGTFDEALKDLLEHVRMQTTFAMQKGLPGLLFKKAEPHYWDMYFENKRRAMMAMMDRRVGTDAEVQIDDVQLDRGLFAPPPGGACFETVGAP